MSITIKSGEAISRSPINNSISKQMYSFSKAPRFTFIDPNIPKEKRFWKIKENIGKTDNYYDIPEFLSKRFTTMGSGKRVDFTLSQKGVNTQYYSNPTDFDPLHPHGPRFSFPKAGAVKREKKKKKEGEEDNGKDKDDDEVKYPPFYNYLKPFGWDAPKFTMRGRNEPKKEDTKKGKEGEKEEEKGDDKDEKKKLKNRKFSIPGPGQYPITVHINEKGKYPVSNISNVSSFKYIYSKEKEKERKEKAKERKKKEEEELKDQGLLPPPVEEVKPLIGKIFNSRFRSSNNGSMYGRYKESDTSKHYPGPGSYRLPSDFGQYLSKDADKYPTENVYPVKKIPFEEKAWRHNMKIIKDEPEEDKHSYLEPEDIEDKKPVDEKHDDEDKKDDDGIEKKEGEDAEKEDKEGQIEKEEEGNNDQEVGGYVEKEEQDDIKVDQKPQDNKEEGEAKPEGEVEHEEKPEGESKPEGQQEDQPETKPEEQAGTKPEGETQAEGQGEAKPEGEPPVEGQGEGEAKPEGEAPVEGQGEGEAKPEGEAPVEGQGEGEAKPEGEDGNGEEIVGGFMDEEEKDDVKPSDEANQG